MGRSPITDLLLLSVFNGLCGLLSCAGIVIHVNTVTSLMLLCVSLQHIHEFSTIISVIIIVHNTEQGITISMQ